MGDDPGHDVAVAHRPGQAVVVQAEGDGVLAVGGQETGCVRCGLRGPEHLDVPDMTSRMVLMATSHRGEARL